LGSSPKDASDEEMEEIAAELRRIARQAPSSELAAPPRIPPARTLASGPLHEHPAVALKVLGSVKLAVVGLLQLSEHGGAGRECAGAVRD
jgi:hypothetical protein